MEKFNWIIKEQYYVVTYSNNEIIIPCEYIQILKDHVNVSVNEAILSLIKNNLDIVNLLV